MKVWRLARLSFASDGPTAYSGIGAARRGARWNSRGVRVAYASDTPSLALVELLAHIDRSILPADLAYFAAQVPDDSIERLTPLPHDWNALPSGIASAKVGDAWTASAASLALMVPSVIVPTQHNVLVNPAHPRFADVVFDAPLPYELDKRIV